MSEFMTDLSNYLTIQKTNDKVASNSTNPRAGSDLEMMDFLKLMVAQFQNQSMDDVASTSEMMGQMVQMSVIQAVSNLSSQLTQSSNMSYAASLVGKEVTLASTVGRKVTEITGTVSGTGMLNGEQILFVNGEQYKLSDVMAVGTIPASVSGASAARAAAPEAAASAPASYTPAATAPAAQNPVAPVYSDPVATQTGNGEWSISAPEPAPVTAEETVSAVAPEAPAVAAEEPAAVTAEDSPALTEPAPLPDASPAAEAPADDEITEQPSENDDALSAAIADTQGEADSPAPADTAPVSPPDTEPDAGIYEAAAEEILENS